MEKLLIQINLITNKYKQIAKEKGENFNLFNILDMRTDEVKTHSAIIGELLNPQGSHDFGDKFLRLFFGNIISIVDPRNQIEKYNYLTNCDLCNVNSIVEYNVGKISEDNTKGGRLDIFLSSDKFEVCIENKINAGDQPYQLRRYHNYLSKSSKKTLLIYLTLDGKSASKESTCNSMLINDKWERDEDDLLVENEDYFCLSYQSEILEWLHECYKLTGDKPILRESLKQYIILIKSLTNQVTNSAMASEIHQVILSDIESSQKIAGEYKNAIKYISTKLRDSVTAELNKIYPLASVKNEHEGNPFSCIYVWFQNEGKHFGIESFNGKTFRNDKGNNSTLLIGQMDWRGKEGEKNKIIHGVWIEDTYQPIWNKETLFEKLQCFALSEDEEIVKELVSIITRYINDNLN